MTKEDIRTAFIEELLDIAPDLELDSMDVLNLVTALHRRLNVDIPETDYPQIATLALAVSYLTARVT